LGAGQGAPAVRDIRAFTLVELLVVVAVIALLLSILLPAMGAAREKMRALKCSSNLRTMAFEFQLFVEHETEGGWGDSDRERPPSGGFYISDFQDYLYKLDEFWEDPGKGYGKLTPKTSAMMCPSGASELTKTRDQPCGKDALNPARDVTIAVNMRLYRATVEFGGNQVLAPEANTSVRTEILNNPYVPLMIEVDGETVDANNGNMFYIAPPLPGDETPYGDGRYWTPSARHDGRVNVAFVGGHVLTSEHPADQNWDWSYQAHVGR
jgi:prepilin-type N-terminal cleavage/methylation domain-containing protein/prepilin-type processing-associated H-X9-DG protein